MKLAQTIKIRKTGSIVKKYRFCGVTILRKEKTPTKKKYTFLGIKISRKHDNTSNSTNITSLNELVQYVRPTPISFHLNFQTTATIIIPVYNGLEHLKKLIPSLIKHTPDTVKIVLIDDNSSDPQISIFLNSISSDKRFIILKNKENLGFVGSINYGMSLIKTQYAIWLNSDTIVPQYWVERLLAPFLQNKKIATTTPFTNSGVIFSFPIFGENNELALSLKDIDKAFQRINCFDATMNEVYSGTGFCMAVNMKCWKSIGCLDVKSFGKGYGEENDWCFRAANKGWKHLLVPNLFVQHCHGGSFQSNEKELLCKEHQKILTQRYPKQMKHIVPEFLKKDPWKKYRDIASILCSQTNAALVIDLKKEANDKSGAIDYQQKLITDLEAQSYKVILLQYNRHQKDTWSIVPFSISSQTEIKLNTLSDIKLLFKIINISKIIINNLAFLSDVENTIDILHDIKETYNPHMTYKFHDYLSVCPSFFLLNNEGKNCQIHHTSDKCDVCLKHNPFLTIIRSDIEHWRKSWTKLFSVIDEFNFFSEYSRNKVLKTYPDIEERSSINEHTPLFSNNYSKYTRPALQKNLTVAFVGAFVYEKGASYFIELADICKEKNINAKFIIIGIDNKSIRHNNVKWVSGYTRDELGKILTQNNVHAVVYSSINNETFSYVAQELMILGVPFICFEDGAPQERIRKYRYPWAEIAPQISADGLFIALQKLLEKVYLTKI